MDTIDRATLADLASHHGFPSVSIYLPTHHTGPAKDQDQIRLRNLVNDAEKRLAEQSVRATEARGLLDEITAATQDALFWQSMGDGLAAFISPGSTRIFRTDVDLPEQLVVGTRFYLRPLALAFHGDRRFYALLLDKNRSRLFEGDGDSVRELELDPSVSSFAETAKYDQREESLQFTTSSSPESVAGSGRRMAGFHGQGGQNVEKNEMTRYMAALEHAVSRQLGPEGQTPLVLMGEMEEIQAYRSANSYQGLADDQVAGAVDFLTDEEVHRFALQVLEPEFSAEEARDLHELENRPSSQVTSDPAEIVVAAATGRVDALFFDQGTGPYGIFDRDLVAVSEVCSAAPRYLRETADTEVADATCGWDLVDLALAETVLHAGRIHTYAGEDPVVGGVAALLRY